MERSRVPEAAASADVERIASYLDGEERVFREVDAWIRREIEARYPVLRAETEDLCQVVHGKLVANLRAGRFDHRCTLRTYVVRIAHYTAIDRIRRMYRERGFLADAALEREVTANSPYRLLESQDERQLLHQVLLHSPLACRELWRLAFLERLSYEEIGRRLSIPPGTVKSRMWHCRRRAQTLLRRFQRYGVPRSAPPRAPD